MHIDIICVQRYSCMSVHIYTYIFMQICMHTPMLVLPHRYIHTYICNRNTNMHMHSCISAYIQTYLHIYNMFACLHKYMYAYTHTCMNNTYIPTNRPMDVCAYTYICMHTYIYIYIHTYSCMPIIDTQTLQTCMHTYQDTYIHIYNSNISA